MLKRFFNIGIYNESSDKLEEFEKLSQFFVQSDSFNEAIQLLTSKRYVIISGEPGVGKTTLAGMLSLLHVNQGYEFIFIRQSIFEAKEIKDPDKKQVFLFDDFLGSDAFHDFQRNEDKALFDFIKLINKSKNKRLIITTREYVFKQAEVKYPELKHLNFAKCSIVQQRFTKAFKINILYNYLYYSNVECKHIKPLIYDDHYKEIIFHRNFTPRLIDDFIHRFYNKEDDSYSLYFGLKKYLDDPYAYWEGIFVKLSEGSKIVLLILAITEEPVLEEVLFETFKRINNYRRLFDIGFEKDSFERSLSELSGSFISISHNPEVQKSENTISSKDFTLIFTSHRSSRFIEFQNPSIKDFSIRYLKKREDLIEFLIKGAFLFNQLFLVFATQTDDKFIEDDDATYPHDEKKIVLNAPLQAILIEKIVSDFDRLPIVKVRRIDWEGGGTTYHLDDEVLNNRMLKLWNLTNNFSLNTNALVKDFVIKTYIELIKRDEENDGPIIGSIKEEAPRFSLEERMYKAELVGRLLPFVKFDPIKTIEGFYDRIKFAKEFLTLHELGKLFPDAYKEIILNNITAIREEIKDTIIDDVDYYLWEGTVKSDEALEELIDFEIEQIFEIYKIRWTKKFKRQINETADKEIFKIDGPAVNEKTKEAIDEVQQISKGSDEQVVEQQYKSYKNALKLLEPEFEDFESTGEVYEYVKSVIDDKIIADRVIKQIENKDSGLFSDLLSNVEQVDVLIKVLLNGQVPVSSIELYAHILQVGIITDEELCILAKLSYKLTFLDLFIFKKATILDILEEEIPDGVLEIIDWLIEKSFITQRDVWFSFLNKDFQIFLTAKYISLLSIDERIAIYKGFRDDMYEIIYNIQETLWQYLFQLDNYFFKSNFILPALIEEFDAISSKNEKDVVLKFFKRCDFELKYQYSIKEQSYEIWSSSNSAVVIEDILREFDWDVSYPFFELEDYFNIGIHKNTPLSGYIKKHCVSNQKEYSININKELSNASFYPLLESSGVPKVILEYVEGLERLITRFNSEIYEPCEAC